MRGLAVATALFTALSVTPSVAADIALDVGHSHAIPGATSASGAREFDLNRKLAQDVATALTARCISVHAIGIDGDIAQLDERTRLAAGDRMFISLHHDSVQPEWLHRADVFSGFSIFVSRRNRFFETSLACAQRIGDRLRAAGYRPSRYHAIPVSGENRPFADEARGIHFFDDLVVLRGATQPALLIEAGVMVNPDDEARITSKAGRRHLAAAIAEGAAACLAGLQTSIRKEDQR